MEIDTSNLTDEQKYWIGHHIFVSVRKTYQDVLDKQEEK